MTCTRVEVIKEEAGEGYAQGQQLMISGGKWNISAEFVIDATLGNSIASVSLTNPGCYSELPTSAKYSKGKQTKLGESAILEEMLADFIDPPETTPAIEAKFNFEFSSFGNGTMMYASGHQYQGQWVKGGRHGHGTYTEADGRKYVGEWKRGQKNGRGTEHWAVGESWTGEFVNGKKHGDGKCNWSEIKSAKMEFNEGEPIVVDMKARGTQMDTIKLMKS
jgi:hypothetical protein